MADMPVQPNASGTKAGGLLGTGIGWGEALNIGQAIISARMRVKEGEDPLSAYLSEAALFFVTEAFPALDFLMLGATLVPAGVQVYNAVKQRNQFRWDMLHKPNVGYGFQDTNQALTMRARAVQAIANSKLNARSILGQEARMMHR